MISKRALKESLAKEEKREIAVYYWDKKEALAMVDAELQLLGRHIVNGYMHNIADAKPPVNKNIWFMILSPLLPSTP